MREKNIWDYALQVIPIIIAVVTLVKLFTIDDYLKYKEFEHSILSDFQKDFADEGKRLFAVLSLSNLNDRDEEERYRFWITRTLIQLIVLDKHIVTMSKEKMDTDKNCQI